MKLLEAENIAQLAKIMQNYEDSKAASSSFFIGWRPP